MPYFAWQGVTLNGSVRHGTLYASSADELHALLFKRDIAVIKSKIVREPYFSKKINLQHMSSLFRNLGQLLAAGVLLPEALIIIHDQIRHLRLQKIVADISLCVQSGGSLSQALQEHPTIFDSLAIQMIYVGDESGTLERSLYLLANHFDKTVFFKKQLRSAVMTPFITLIFFMIVAAVILIGILPRFVNMFSAYNQELPYITSCLMSISAWLCSWKLIALGAFIVGSTGILRRYIRSREGKTWLYRWVMQVPFWTIYKQRTLLYFMRSVAILLDGGIALPDALVIGCHALPQEIFKDRIASLARDVQDGNSLSNAMLVHPDNFFENDILALVKIGEESGQLGAMLGNVADCYQEAINHYLALITTLVQPLLMIALGLLIVALIVSVYLPLLQFSQCIR